MRLRLFARKECWVPTVRGWLVLGTIFLSCVVVLARCVAPFLCVTHPLPAQVLIVEGWLPDYALQGAIAEFQRGDYAYVVTSGGPSDEVESRFHFKTWAEFAAANLVKLGLQSNSIVPAPSEHHLRDRTYSSAMAAKEVLYRTNIVIRAVNVYSLGAHARRSQLLFEQAFGDQVKVGVVAHPDNSYDPACWWKSSRGVQEIVGEGIGYVYARVIFHPSTASDRKHHAANRPAS